MSDRGIYSLICQRPSCGQSFLTRHREAKYCSTTCAGQSRRKSLPARNCAVCGESFEPNFRRPNQQFCSAECHRKSRKPADRDCPQCGKTFSPDRTAARFCSLECAWKGQGRPGKRNNKTCKHGHPWAEETTRWEKGRRHCIPCDERRSAGRVRKPRPRPAQPAKRAQPKPRPKPRPPLPPVPAAPTAPPRPVWRPAGFAPEPVMPKRACASSDDPHAQ